MTPWAYKKTKVFNSPSSNQWGETILFIRNLLLDWPIMDILVLGCVYYILMEIIFEAVIGSQTNLITVWNFKI